MSIASALVRFRSLGAITSRRSNQLLFFSTQRDQQHYNVTIVGGGAVGLTMAKLLQDTCSRYSITLLDRGSGVPVASDNDAPLISSSLIPHPRSYALSPKSLNLIGTDVCSKLPLGEYHSMQIWEANSPAMLVFSNEYDLKDQSNLGACVEDSALVSALQASLSRDVIQYRTAWKDISFPSNANKIEITTAPANIPDTPDHQCASSSTFTTDLLIAADGAQSPVRTKLGMGWKGLEYGRTAVTFTVELSQPNNYNSSTKKRAYQRFLPYGPIALLPTYSHNHAVVVWSTTPAEAATLKSMDSNSLTKLLNEKLQQGPQRLKPLLEREGKTDPISSLLYGMERVLDTVHYGMGMRHWSDDPEKFMAPPLVSSVPDESPRFTFPLSCKLASQYTHHHASNRVALIGDAAHTVHPMAGQGLNIGLEDVEALVRTIRKAHDCGMEASQFLADYEQNRQWNVPQKIGGIHLLHTLFGMQSAPLMHGKSIGMSMINQLGPLRRQLAKIATGSD
jgi:ubiquinone biosynthesis UbiH/UbiF/VisC/COQ6 family hydroxylase